MRSLVRKGCIARDTYSGSMQENYEFEQSPNKIAALKILNGSPLSITSKMKERIRQMIDLTAPYSTWAHLNCTGFHRNPRMIHMFGLAVVQMAQYLRQLIIRKNTDKIRNTEEVNDRFYEYCSEMASN